MFYIVSMMSPSSQLQHQKSVGRHSVPIISLNVRCSILNRVMLLRGGSSESHNESEPGSSERFQDYPLPVANDNLEELLGKETEEEDPLLDDVITHWADEPANETESSPLSDRTATSSNASDSQALEVSERDSFEETAEESLPVPSNHTSIENIRQNVAKRKSAR